MEVKAARLICEEDAASIALGQTRGREWRHCARRGLFWSLNSLPLGSDILEKSYPELLLVFSVGIFSLGLICCV